ncbi:RNA-processing protein [archaeon]|nr:RNA-processing protein [archaeon]|tara:strand:- start:425 stop:958 length:534 start_codon:yes stop_codon:yes gene_type:complete
MIKNVRIPIPRIAVLIGKNGATRKNIENSCDVKLKIYKIGGNVEIEGEALGVVIAEVIVTAIARGFSPEKANLLHDENRTLAILNISDDKRELKRIKSRLIGTGGKSRRNMERLTGTYISVYGKTVSIIGPHENVDKLQSGLEKLIKGTSHRFVYQHLERVFSKMRKREKKREKNGR